MPNCYRDSAHGGKFVMFQNIRQVPPPCHQGAKKPINAKQSNKCHPRCPQTNGSASIAGPIVASEPPSCRLLARHFKAPQQAPIVAALRSERGCDLPISLLLSRNSSTAPKNNFPVPCGAKMLFAGRSGRCLVAQIFARHHCLSEGTCYGSGHGATHGVSRRCVLPPSGGGHIMRHIRRVSLNGVSTPLAGPRAGAARRACLPHGLRGLREFPSVRGGL